MPALVATKYEAEIIYLGHVKDRDAALTSDPVSEMELSFGGYGAEAHAGLTRPSCSRVTALYPKGTQIRNTRQVSLIAEEELSQIAEKMGIGSLRPEWLGASVMVKGIPNFTHLPPSARLQAPSGATLVVDMENRPCHLPAPVIDQHHDGAGRAFKSAAKGKRGVTAWVECEGKIAIGDRLKLFVPDQPKWSEMAK